MHILVINDDGPPSSTSSPYVHSFVNALRDRGHLVSVVLPHVQRSWISKAHFVNETAKPTYFRPGTVHEDNGTTHELPIPEDDAASKDVDEWVLVNGTPATCAQLGLFHFYKDRGPIDLVVSGPNFGRNSTSLFSLSSGTIGGAMEASCCGAKAVALSFAFDKDRRYNRELIEAGCRLGARLSEYLGLNWDQGVDLYNINIPLIPDLENKKVLWTSVLQNSWKSGSSYQPVESVPKGSAGDKEAQLRKGEGDQAAVSTGIADPSLTTTKPTFSRHEHRNFKWMPSFADVHNSVTAAAPGTDGWAILHDCISVTPLKANFMHTTSHGGELKLDLLESGAMLTSQARAYIRYEDDYVQPLIEAALAELCPSLETVQQPLNGDFPDKSFLQISSYEIIDHDQLFRRSTSFVANSYIIRKALIRKEYLASVVRHWAAKNPDATLASCLPETISLHLDYAEFLDDALMEGDGMTLLPIMSKNAGVDPVERSWWMVKASMADRGQGIRLFSTFEELQNIFEAWEEWDDGDDEEDADEDTNDRDIRAQAEDDSQADKDSGEGMTSSLRHFVLQRYIEPLLLPAKQNRKFHIRCYVVAVGALKVYVSREMLALFSAKPYSRPEEPAADLDLSTHLTNTCLQDGTREGSVERFWDLPDLESHPGWKETQFESICKATEELFQAAKAAPTDFQPLPNAFELYGVDWLVGEHPIKDGSIRPWLLEVNAFPDLKQTGHELKDLIGSLWKGIVTAAVAPLLKVDVVGGKSSEDHGLVNVLDLDMQR